MPHYKEFTHPISHKKISLDITRVESVEETSGSTTVVMASGQRHFVVESYAKVLELIKFNL